MLTEKRISQGLAKQQKLPHRAESAHVMTTRVAWLGLLIFTCALAFGQQKLDVEKVQARYRTLIGNISEARLAETVRWMAAQGSRVAGYPGADRAADYIEQQFRAIGLQNVQREAFPITVPVDEGASLELLPSLPNPLSRDVGEGEPDSPLPRSGRGAGAEG